MKNNQSGNVLFYILIAVGLLAALSYVVAQNSRGGVSGLGKDKAAIYATEIIEYGNVLSQAVSQIRLRGYADTEISFENNEVSGYANANCTESGCKIFNINGGAVHYMKPQTSWLDSTKSAALRYGEVYFHGSARVIGVGTNNDDLIMFIPYLKKEICIAINDKLDIKPTSDDVPSETHGPFAVNIRFVGTYGFPDRKVSGDGTTGQTDILNNRTSGCTEASGTASVPSVGSYHFYQVLIGR